jgi:transaldolase
MASSLTVKIFADGADIAGMLEMAADPLISGLTTNPTLMRQAGVTDYRAFAKEVLAGISDKPISFEVFSDEFPEMERQALEIASLVSNGNVKIPITNTRGESAAPLVERLSAQGVKVNVTAMMTREQVESVAPALSQGAGGYVSVFAGRIADTGKDPVPVMKDIVEYLSAHPGVELIWASPREVLNIVHADMVGCHIITVTNSLIRKMSLFGKDLPTFSLETVQMFYNDAHAAGYTL